jgi:hypothetical protein
MSHRVAYLLGLLLALALWCGASAAQAAVYYLDDDGTNTPGCESASACGSSACLTHAYLLTRATPTSGDVVRWCPGTYTDWCMCPRDGVTYESSTGNRADVTFSRTSGGACSCGQTVAGDNWATFYFPDGGVADGGDGAIIRHLSFANITGTSTTAIYVRRGRHDVLIDDVEISRTDGHCGLVVGDILCAGATYCNDISAAPYNITVQNSSIHDTNWHGIFMPACKSGCVIQGNTIASTGWAGASPGGISGADGIHIANVGQVAVAHNVFHDTSEAAIDLSRTAPGQTDGTDFLSGYCTAGSTADRRCQDDADCGTGGVCSPWVIERNLAYRGQAATCGGCGGTASGIEIHAVAYKGIIRNNMFIADSYVPEPRQAFDYEQCIHHVTIANNTILGRVILYANAYGMTWENNLFLASANANNDQIVINTVTDNRAQKLSPLRPDGGLADNTWDYNVVYGASAHVVWQNSYSTSDWHVDFAKDAADGNAYPLQTQYCQHNTGLADQSAVYQQGDVATFRTDHFWSNDTGQGAHDRWQAPTVVNATSDPPDLHLSGSDTAARDMGVTLSVVPTDYDGQSRPIGSAYDIGADEYDSGSTTTTTTTSTSTTVTTTTNTTTSTTLPAEGPRLTGALHGALR